MSEIKQFILIKTTPNDVFCTIPLASNPSIRREVYLTKKHPQQPLPADYALGVMADPSLYSLFKKGYFTFNDVDSLAKMAYEEGYLFDDKFDFEPASKEDSNLIFSILRVGNRAKIEETLEKYGVDKVKAVAIEHLDDLTQNVIQMLEKVFKVQLVLDNAIDLE